MTIVVMQEIDNRLPHEAITLDREAAIDEIIAHNFEVTDKIGACP